MQQKVFSIWSDNIKYGVSPMKVSDIMIKDVITVDKSTRLSHVLDLFEKYRISRVVVVDSKDKPIGIATEKDIADKLGSTRARDLPASRLTISSVMASPLVTVSPETDLLDAVEMMASKNISSVVVVFGDTLLGIVTKTDVIRLFKDDNRTQVNRVLCKSIKTVNPDDRVIFARSILVKSDLDHLIVVRDSKPIGLVTDRDIAIGLAKIRSYDGWRHLDSMLDQFLVINVMVQAPPTVNPTTPLGKAVEIMLNKHLKALPVVDSEGILMGSVSKTSIVEAVANGTLKLPS